MWYSDFLAYVDKIVKFLRGDFEYSESNINDFMKLYRFVENLFVDIKRNNGYNYLSHLTGVLNLLFHNSNNLNLFKILLALNHDTIEDTHETFESLKQKFWEEHAFWVLLLTKKPFYDLIDDENEKEFYKNNHKNKSSLNEAQLENIKKLTNRRNEEHFTNMLTLKSFYNNAFKLRSKYCISLTDERVSQICFETVEIKYFDRIDNLRTAEIYTENNEKNRKKAYKKIEETKKYFYGISKKLIQI